MSKAYLILLPLCLLSGCSATPLVQQDLQHHHWLLTGLDDKVITPSKPTPSDLEIAENFTVNGMAGCNHYVGQGHLVGDRFWVTSLAVTQKGCSDEEIAREEAILATLRQGATLQGSREQLVLQGEQHRLTYTLQDWL